MRAYRSDDMETRRPTLLFVLFALASLAPFAVRVGGPEVARHRNRAHGMGHEIDAGKPEGLTTDGREELAACAAKTGC